MSFVGKILVVCQLVLSVMFMAFAGAVHSAHENWRKEANKQKGFVQTKDKELADTKAAAELDKTNSSKEVKNQSDRADKAEFDNRTLKQQNDQLTKEVNENKTKLAAAEQLAKIAGEEAKTRRDEAILQREINTKLHASREEQFKEKTKLEDELQGLKTDFDGAQNKVKDLLNQVAMYRRVLEANNISSDPRDLAANVSVPPRVEGKVLEIKTPHEPGKTELLEISVGSDDGLTKGHELFVFRSALQTGGKPKYLGKIRIVRTTPDRCVAEVLEKVRNGIIEKGDHVQTKL